MISVIVTTYNRPSMTREAIDSALAQTHDDFEVIVVDDGSTDETPQVMAEYGDRIRYIRKENGGVASARNVGIEAAKGDLIAFLDDDDIWLPEKLAVQQAYADAHPEVGLIYTDCTRFNEHGPARDPKGRTQLSGWVFKEFVEKYFVIFSTIVVPRKAIEQIGNFDEEYLRGDDVDFMGRVLEHYPAGYIDQKLIRRRKYARPKSAADLRLSAEEQLIYVRKFSERYGADKLPARWAARKRARAEMKLGQASEAEGNADEARTHYRRAMQSDPFLIKSYRRWLTAKRRARRARARNGEAARDA